MYLIYNYLYQYLYLERNWWRFELFHPFINHFSVLVPSPLFLNLSVEDESFLGDKWVCTRRTRIKFRDGWKGDEKWMQVVFLVALYFNKRLGERCVSTAMVSIIWFPYNFKKNDDTKLMSSARRRLKLKTDDQKIFHSYFCSCFWGISCCWMDDV